MSSGKYVMFIQNENQFHNLQKYERGMEEAGQLPLIATGKIGELSREDNCRLLQYTYRLPPHQA
jgi:hypothetical protein